MHTQYFLFYMADPLIGQGTSYPVQTLWIVSIAKCRTPLHIMYVCYLHVGMYIPIQTGCY